MEPFFKNMPGKWKETIKINTQNCKILKCNRLVIFLFVQI